MSIEKVQISLRYDEIGIANEILNKAIFEYFIEMFMFEIDFAAKIDDVIDGFNGIDTILS